MHRKSLLFVALLLAILALSYAGPTSHTLAAVSPLPPGGTIPTPAPTDVPDPLPGEPGNPIQPIDHPAQLEQIAEALGMPLQAIKRLPPQAYNGLIKANAAKLRVNVWERGEDGEFHLTAKGREEKPEKPKAEPQVRAVAANNKVYLPTISASELLSVANVEAAINLAKGHVDRLYASAPNSSWGYIKEYVGFPLWIYRGADNTFPRMAGHYFQGHSFALIQWFHIYETSEQMFITFEDGYDWDYAEPGLYAYRAYGEDGTTTYQVQVYSFSSSTATQLWLGSHLIDNDLRSIPSGWYQLTTTVNGTSYPAPLPAHRYTLKHASMLGEHIYDIWNDSRETKLDAVLNQYGFGPDIYNPLFKLDTSQDKGYIFTTTPYHDCTNYTFNGVNSTLPWGLYQSSTGTYTYYPYEPKECTLGINNYLELAKVDYLSPILQAIHVLNKYNDADYAYCRPYPVGCIQSSPRIVARQMESGAWNGYGIQAYGKPAEYASAVRSNSFLVLETLLGYKYGDATSKQYADSLARELLGTLWGTSDWGLYRGSTGDDGQVLRPQHYGGQMVSWVQEVTAAEWSNRYIYSLPPRTWLSEIIDYFNMPSEVEGVLPTNAEASATFIQAMRTYLKWRWGVYYPNSELLP